MTTLYAALAIAQGAMPLPPKDRTVKTGVYSFTYATLDSIISTARPHLAANGLGFAQFIADGQMITRIFHASGEFMDCGLPMPTLPAKAQDAGGLVSYYRRYSLSAALGLVADEDADGDTPGTVETKPVKPAFPDGPHRTKTALDAAITAFCTHIAALTNDADLEAYVTEQTPVLAQYRAVYGRDSEHTAAIHTQLANARERVKARADTPHDAEPVPVEPAHVWSETTQRLVAECQNRETIAALNAWKVKAKPLLDTLDAIEAAYVRGAVADRVTAINAMDMVAS